MKTRPIGGGGGLRGDRWTDSRKTDEDRRDKYRVRAEKVG